MKESKQHIVFILVVSFSFNCLASTRDLNPAKIEAKKDTLSDYQILTDSTVKYLFGTGCGYGATPPKGRRSIDNLIRNKDYQTIKLVLDGLNNEGKIYAIEALLSLNSEKKIELSKADKDKMKAIIEQDLLIYRCQGCGISTITTIDLFSEKALKKLLKKNRIEITNR